MKPDENDEQVPEIVKGEDEERKTNINSGIYIELLNLERVI